METKTRFADALTCLKDIYDSNQAMMLYGLLNGWLCIYSAASWFLAHQYEWNEVHLADDVILVNKEDVQKEEDVENGAWEDVDLGNRQRGNLTKVDNKQTDHLVKLKSPDRLVLVTFPSKSACGVEQRSKLAVGQFAVK